MIVITILVHTSTMRKFAKDKEDVTGTSTKVDIAQVFWVLIMTTIVFNL